MEFLQLSALIVFAVIGTAVLIAAVVHYTVAADAATRRQDNRVRDTAVRSVEPSHRKATTG